MATYNPWHVKSIKAFYYLKCPECEFDTKKESIFEDHAIENHPMSFELFVKNSPKKEEFNSVPVKKEQMSDFYEKENDCEQFLSVLDYDTKMVDENDSSAFGEVKKEPIDDNFSIEDHSNLKNQVAFDHEGHHFMSVLEEKKPYKCSYCEDSFKQSKELLDHITSVHEGKKPFKCSRCEEGFTSIQGLQEHYESVHEGEYLYNCSHCNKNFSSEPNLNKHIRTVHEGKSRTFLCTICNYDFQLKRDLKEHMMEHQKNKLVKRKNPSISIGEEFNANTPSKSLKSGLNKESNTIDSAEIDNLNNENQKEFSICEEKPKMSYGQLIAEALSNASGGKLVLSDIYTSISFRHPYYKLDNPTWQNGIRYDLTVNKSFTKAEKATAGWYWKLSDDLTFKVSKYLKSINQR